MPSLNERLRVALAPRYRLLHEVGSGGMARVFKAEDTVLDRPVAVKVLRPELATAVGAERFLREARALAAMSHPNVIAIHECGEADGNHYYVMDFEESPTLRDCLDTDGCPQYEAWRLAVDLAAALEATHGSGLIHRDVKPSNIFLRPDRAVLADFGIVAEVEESDTPLTEAGAPGTPAYMAPEQVTGGGASERSDIYAAAMVLYEAFAGRRWVGFQDPKRADWSDVPRRARPVLARALELDPARRWPDAGSFRLALRRARRRRPTGLRLTVAGLAVVLAAVLLWPSEPAFTESFADLAILPCRPMGDLDASVGRSAASYATDELSMIRGLQVAEGDRVMNLWEDSIRRPAAADWTAWTAALKSRWVADCWITPTGDGARVALELRSPTDAVGPVRRVVASVDALTTGRQLFDASLEALVLAGVDDIEVDRDEVGALSRYEPEAVRDYLNGKNAFRHDQLRRATELFAGALALEPEFALAEWRLAEAERWLAHTSVDVDLQELWRDRSGGLPVRDSMLLAARIAPYGEQPARFRAVHEAYPNDAYVTLLYADELYHRGGLWEVPLDSAIALLRKAKDQDPDLAPAVEHLTQALIRTGDADASFEALRQLKGVSGLPSELDVYYPRLWGLAWLQRFGEPEDAGDSIAALLSSPDAIEVLRLGARWIRYVELPGVQVQIGLALSQLGERTGSGDDVARGLLARGLGQSALGNLRSARFTFDTIALRVDTDLARVQAAEWRAVPYGLGLEGADDPLMAQSRDVLRQAWGNPSVEPDLKVRAAAALGLLAARDDEPDSLRAWRDRIRALEPALSTDAAHGPGVLLEAIEAARAGDAATALEISEPLLAYDSIGLETFPFHRAEVYWLRSRWLAEQGDTDGAIRALYWHENTDLEEGTPPGIAQAAEVDAALGNHARARTVELASSRRHQLEVAGLTPCALVRTRAAEVARQWEGADEALWPLRSRVAEMAEQVERECET